MIVTLASIVVSLLKIPDDAKAAIHTGIATYLLIGAVRMCREGQKGGAQDA